uniref:Uncharacterized protein n=1 Tax=Oryza sativa subsp. japonica TaxID=39947 RepID=Q6EPT3_ORYSJ|nr:hypothetical protein [Oryza sativa Japonica Group]
MSVSTPLLPPPLSLSLPSFFFFFSFLPSHRRTEGAAPAKDDDGRGTASAKQRAAPWRGGAVEGRRGGTVARRGDGGVGAARGRVARRGAASGGAVGRSRRTGSGAKRRRRGADAHLTRERRGKRDGTHNLARLFWLAKFGQREE